MAYTKYSLTPANNTATPPDGAPEGMLPSAVNDTMRDMMAQIRDCGDGIRGGTYTMTAPVITGGTVTGVAFTGNTFTSPVITGGSINNTPIGASTANTGAFTTLSASGVATFSAGTVSAPAITTTGDTNTGIFFPAADTIAFTEGGAEAMRIDSSGNVGIGTSSPSFPLDVAGAIRSNSWIGRANVSAPSADAAIYRAADNTLAFSTTSTERMRIDSSGNVGIGTSSPSSYSKFTVYGSTGNGITYADGTVQAYLGTSGSAIGLSGTVTNHPYAFYTNATERMRITSGGLLLVNSTSTVLSSQHNITGGTNAGLGVMTLQNASNTTYSHSIGANSSGAFIVYRTSDNAGVYLSWGGTSWTANSDERLKTDLKPITDAINKVSTLRAVTGRYKKDEENVSRSFLIAQDVQKVLPEAINEQDDENKTLGLSYTDTIPLLVAAIKEQQQIINDLKARIETLESK